MTKQLVFKDYDYEVAYFAGRYTDIKTSRIALFKFDKAYPEKVTLVLSNRDEPIPEDLEVLKEYEEEEYNDWGPEETPIIIAYYQDYPIPESKMFWSGGWISPEGKFYACRWMEHNELACDLCLCFLQKHGDMMDLKDAGWVQVHNSGYIFIWAPKDSGPGVLGVATKKQIRRLKTLFKVPNSSPAWKEGIKDFIRDYEKEAK